MKFEVKVTSKMLMITMGTIVMKTIVEKTGLESTHEGTKNVKDRQYASYVNKFIREFVVEGMNTKESYQKRFARIAKVVKDLSATVTNIRTLNNNLRREFDNGKVKDFQKKWFYEGKMRDHKAEARAAKTAEKEKAPAKKAPAKKAEKAEAVAEPAEA